MQKKMVLYLILIILVFFSLTNAIAQNYMQITQIDGKVTLIRLSDITKLTFSSPTTETTLQRSKELQKILKLKTYPNPTYDFINIDYELKSQENINLEIYNLSGILINKFLISNQGAGKQTYQCDLSNLPTGAYILKLIQNNKILFDKVIKNN